MTFARVGQPHTPALARTPPFAFQNQWNKDQWNQWNQWSNKDKEHNQWNQGYNQWNGNQWNGNQWNSNNQWHGNQRNSNNQWSNQNGRQHNVRESDFCGYCSRLLQRHRCSSPFHRCSTPDSHHSSAPPFAPCSEQQRRPSPWRLVSQLCAALFVL